MCIWKLIIRYLYFIAEDVSIMFAHVTDVYLERLFNTMDERLRGPWIKSSDEIRPPGSSPRKRGKKKEVRELVVAGYEEARIIKKTLKNVQKKYVPVSENGDCVFNAYLSNIDVPEGYDAGMLRRQLVAFTLKNMPWFENKIHPQNESMESYLRNIASGLCFGDRHCLEVISMMWKTTISVVNPHGEPIKIWHDLDLEDVNVIICWNGNNHYVGTCFIEEPHIRLRSIDAKIHVKHSEKKKKTPIEIAVKKEPDESVSPETCDQTDKSENVKSVENTEHVNTDDVENMSTKSDPSVETSSIKSDTGDDNCTKTDNNEPCTKSDVLQNTGEKVHTKDNSRDKSVSHDVVDKNKTEGDMSVSHDVVDKDNTESDMSVSRNVVDKDNTESDMSVSRDVVDKDNTESNMSASCGEGSNESVGCDEGSNQSAGCGEGSNQSIGCGEGSNQSQDCGEKSDVEEDNLEIGKDVGAESRNPNPELDKPEIDNTKSVDENGNPMISPDVVNSPGVASDSTIPYTFSPSSPANTPNQDPSVLLLVDEAISSGEQMKTGRKREQMISPKFPKKARLELELEEKVEKLKKITLDMNVMEKCMGFLKTKKEEICSELEEFGVDMSELESSDVSHWSLSQNLSLSQSVDMRLDPDSVRTSDRETESLEKSDHEEVENADDSLVLIEYERGTKSDTKSDKAKEKGSKKTDSSLYEKPNLKEFSKKSGLKKVSKKIDFKEVSKKLNFDAVTKFIKKEVVESTSSQNVANIAPLPVDPKSDEDSDCIILSDSSYEFPTISEQKIEEVDLTKVKKEKGVGKGKDDEIPQIEGLTRNIIKNMLNIEGSFE